MPKKLALRVNGAARSVTVDPDTPLLYVLRNDLELNGAKYGCGQAQCGANGHPCRHSDAGGLGRHTSRR